MQYAKQKLHKPDAQTTANNVWRRILHKSKSRIALALYRQCCRSIQAVDFNGQTLELIAPTVYTTHIFNRYIKPILEETASAIAQRPFFITIRTKADPAAKQDGAATANTAKQNGSGLAKKQNIPEETPFPVLRPQFTFESFIVGASNMLAYAAAQNVINTPGKSYNPLFIYGGVGLGKTHLMVSIGHALQHKGLLVRYVTTEDIINDIIQMIQTQTEKEFHDRYRNIDVLLVDDIQFIGGKDRTEEEFFHIFNTLHSANKQIVITSDRPPRMIPTLQDRLRSRFEWGLLADIMPPAYETRLEILQAKAAKAQAPVPQYVLETLAKPDGASPRTLEGALNSVIMRAKARNGAVSISDAYVVMRESLSVEQKLPIDPEVVVDIVAQYYHIPIDDIIGKKRNKECAWPRQVAMYLLRKETDTSLSQIGAALGGRDHTTIMYGYDHVANSIKINQQLQFEITSLLVKLREMQQ